MQSQLTIDTLQAPPDWTFRLFGVPPSPDPAVAAPASGTASYPAVSVRTVRMAMVMARIPGASELGEPELRRAVRETYLQMREEAEEAGTPHPLRFWNFLPGIHEPVGDGVDRYIAFNAGRYDAICRWLSGPAAFERSMPTSTAVGHRGTDLWVYCLAGSEPGRPVENPRQRPAYRYSRKYGNLPPCFSRATLLPGDGAATLLVGGTSSVLGEDSVHVGCLGKQVEQTLENLVGLIGSAATGSRGESGAGRDPADCVEDLRVYHVNPAHREAIRCAVARRFRNLERMELFRADICRADLMVEIEGLAVFR